MTCLRIATYNVHKCQGMDGRVRPERIADVLREVRADVVALQEVVRQHGRSPGEDQPQYLSHALGMPFVMGQTRLHQGGAYGNAVLTRLPVLASESHILSVPRREPRGALRVDLEWPDRGLLHVFNVHLGTAFLERRRQARMMVDDACLTCDAVRGPRVVLGDFNEWTSGLASRMLREHLSGPDLRERLARRRTYPGLLPLLHLDHIYYDPLLHAEHAFLHRSKLALLASDHLPLVADFRWQAEASSAG